jgi:hypothetical protein
MGLLQGDETLGGHRACANPNAPRLGIRKALEQSIGGTQAIITNGHFRRNIGPLKLMTINIKVAEQFGHLIAKADYSAAHTLLTKAAQRTHSPEAFKAAVEGMTAYTSDPIRQVEVMSDFVLEEWPDKQDGDVAIAYVALTGDGFCEAVTVTLAQEGKNIRIRQLE